ncbi:MAG: amidohydrolase family protein [Verrucomicrobiota bacterium]
MIIDAHTHIRVDIPNYAADRKNVYGIVSSGPDEYLAQYRRNGVDACFTFGQESFRNASVAMAENEALSAVQRQYPARIYAWATVCPGLPEAQLRRDIRQAIMQFKLRGLKFVPICQGIALSSRGMAIVAEEAIALNVPVTTHDGSPEYSSAIQVVYYARKYPELRVLSAHSGLRELWPDFLDAVMELPNLYLCLSGPTQWGLQKLYDTLGPEKLLFGSDGGLGHPAVITAYLRRIEHLKAPAEHKTMILGTNALRFIRGEYNPKLTAKSLS